MTNKKFLMGILTVVLIFGMTVVGCDDDDSDDSTFDTMHKPNFYGTWVCPVGGQGGSLATAKPYTITISENTFFITNANYVSNNLDPIGWKKIENLTWTSMENPSTNTEFVTNTDYPVGYKLDGNITFGTNWGDGAVFVALNQNGTLLFSIANAPSNYNTGGMIICNKQ
jgi:hypothetical protein